MSLPSPGVHAQGKGSYGRTLPYCNKEQHTRVGIISAQISTYVEQAFRQWSVVDPNVHEEEERTHRKGNKTRQPQKEAGSAISKPTEQEDNIANGASHKLQLSSPCRCEVDYHPVTISTLFKKTPYSLNMNISSILDLK